MERTETLHGSPPRTIMLGGRRVSLEESQPQGETEQLDAQQADVIESDPSDSSDDDYQPIPQMAP